MARKILFEENRPTGVISSPEFVSLGFMVHIGCVFSMLVASR
jgi:hypothetical protein